jgi:hypothetical protein
MKKWVSMEYEAIRYNSDPLLDTRHFLFIYIVSGGLGERNSEENRGRALGR